MLNPPPIVFCIIHIFYDASIHTQCHTHSHGTCVHPDLHLDTIYALVSPDRIWLTYSGHCFHQHMTERGIPDFIVPVLAWCLKNAVATLSQVHTRKWPTSFPHRENMCWRVTMQGISGTLLHFFHRRESFSPQTCRPRTLDPSPSHSGSLQTNQ